MLRRRWGHPRVDDRNNIRPEIADDGQHVEGLKKFVTYINKQWINKRLSVRDNRIVSH